ncbi:hypothetical protein 812a_077 [Staphylococcus phage 812]|nr:hypothetical protein ST812_077 [Staphylococcus phage 812]AHY25605.1 hypothetical protein 812_077 [Staphylococcus phage 812]AHY25826.1 hypothetical protein 812a_077 [Staphylococcus phage 812]AHY26043.1 hypothetical protein K1_077 [Staphylococcus phage 812]AHY26259.1 hypothetical protein 812F1_077 [Staphylococcus phage 812]
MVSIGFEPMTPRASI